MENLSNSLSGQPASANSPYNARLGGPPVKALVTATLQQTPQEGSSLTGRLFIWVQAQWHRFTEFFRSLFPCCFVRQENDSKHPLVGAFEATRVSEPLTPTSSVKNEDPLFSVLQPQGESPSPAESDLLVVSQEKRDKVCTLFQKIAMGEVTTLLAHQKEIEAEGKKLEDLHPLAIVKLLTSDIELCAYLLRIFDYYTYGYMTLRSPMAGVIGERFVAKLKEQLEVWKEPRYIEDLRAPIEQFCVSIGLPSQIVHDQLTKSWEEVFAFIFVCGLRRHHVEGLRNKCYSIAEKKSPTKPVDVPGARLLEQFSHKDPKNHDAEVFVNEVRALQEKPDSWWTAPQAEPVPELAGGVPLEEVVERKQPPEVEATEPEAALTESQRGGIDTFIDRILKKKYLGFGSADCLKMIASLTIDALLAYLQEKHAENMETILRDVHFSRVFVTGLEKQWQEPMKAYGNEHRIGLGGWRAHLREKFQLPPTRLGSLLKR